MSDISTGLSVNLPEENALVKIDDSGGGDSYETIFMQILFSKERKTVFLK